jgi:magnesium and cobalt transporter
VEQSSDKRFLTILRNLFRKDDPIEERLREAEAEGELKREDVSILRNVLTLEETQVLEIMVPRTDIACAEADSSLKDIAELIVACGHSRIPIFRENKDHIVGIVHAKDLLRPLLHPGDGPDTVRALMRPPFFVPETTNVKSLMHTMQSGKIHMAVALDEYGGTSGLVTFEDILEEIVGEIRDEYDALRPEEIRELPDGSLLVSGRTPLDEVNERLGLALDSEQVETIGGYLCELAGRIPRQGEFFTLEGRQFRIEEADAKQVRLVHVQPAGQAA